MRIFFSGDGRSSASDEIVLIVVAVVVLVVIVVVVDINENEIVRNSSSDSSTPNWCIVVGTRFFGNHFSSRQTATLNWFEDVTLLSIMSPTLAGSHHHSVSPAVYPSLCTSC